MGIELSALLASGGNEVFFAVSERHGLGLVWICIWKCCSILYIREIRVTECKGWVWKMRWLFFLFGFGEFANFFHNIKEIFVGFKKRFIETLFFVNGAKNTLTCV